MKNHPAFTLLREKQIASLDMTIFEYEHSNTGALHYHFQADNSENVFLVGLRTVPTDSCGVAHILEHTALCGSQRYPVRDPFFMMIRRSLNTFMNAFTSSDWTAYPFASQNKKDFNNLLDVYLDAVFFSRLDLLDFRQEGHRLEFVTPDDPNSDLVFKGVVFNEMKGSMSSPISQLWQHITSQLFPTTTYHFNSGGEPADIPNLTYDALIDFYKRHYHPSNAVFMTYGDIPAEEHQAIFEDRVLSRFSRSNDKISVPREKRYSEPQRIEAYYPLDAAEADGDKTHIVFAWLLDESTDLQKSIEAQLLSRVLLENSASPLLHALETCGLGSAPSPLCGLEDSYREMSFMCGLEGSRPELADEVEKLIFSVLNNIAEKGLEKSHLEAALHQLELGQREITGNQSPYGLQLIQTALPSAIHRGDPIAMLNIDPVLEHLHQAIQDPDYIKRLIKEMLINNKHWVRLLFLPDTTLGARREAEEKARCDAIKQKLTDAEKQQIIRETEALKERQTLTENLDILPKVTLDDIAPELNIAKGEIITTQQQAFHFYPQGTNGLVYIDLIYDLPNLSAEAISLLPHYFNTFAELGAGTRSYTEMQAWQSQVSGGISACTSIRNEIANEQALIGKWVVSTKGLSSHYNKLCDLMQTTLQSQRYDELDRIRELTSQFRAAQEQRIVSNGHSFAMQAACAGMSPLAHLRNSLHGLSAIKTLKIFDDEIQSNSKKLSQLAEQLKNLHETLLQSPKQALLIAEQDKLAGLSEPLYPLLNSNTNSSAFNPFTLPPIRSHIQQMWLTSTTVSFCAKAYPSVPVSHPDCPALTVLAPFLRNGYLHGAIREQGGAYGGGASQDNDIAAFRFYSYRDPRLVETLEDFDRSLEWLMTHKHSLESLEEAILGIIAALDKPGSPSGEARDTYYNRAFGRSDEHRNAFRQAILKVTLNDLQRVARQYLTKDKASIAVLTAREIQQKVGDLGLEVNQL